MKIHIVKKGESMYSIAQKHHVTLEQLIAFNPQIAEPEQIDEGMKVKIPMFPKPVEPPPEKYAYKHTVKQGDSLWKLSKAWDIPLQDMIKANPQLKNPNVLMTGEAVYIPKLDNAQEGMPGKAMMPPAAEIPEVPLPSQSLVPPTSELTEAAPMAPGGFELPPGAPITPAFEMPEAIPVTPGFELPEVQQPAEQMPSFQMPTASMPPLYAYPSKAPSLSPMPEVELNQPYSQSVHPFFQMQVQATEVFAHAPEQQPAGYPMYQEAVPAFIPYQQTGGCGCGCGEKSTNQMQPDNWNAYSQMQGAYAGQPMYPPAQLPLPAMHEALANPCFAGGLGLPYGYMPQLNMMPTGYPYPAPYEAPVLPQIDRENTAAADAETSELKDSVASSDSANNRNTSSKKAKISRTSAIRTYVKKQSRDFKREKRPNLPWINR